MNTTAKVPERSFSDKKITPPVTIEEVRKLKNEQPIKMPKNKHFWLALCAGVLGGIVTATVFITFFMLLGEN